MARRKTPPRLPQRSAAIAGKQPDVAPAPVPHSKKKKNIRKPARRTKTADNAR
jgi:hypothetical protein